ncbi:MAG: hypothetical protein ACJA0H_000098 [Francisellaceae bacterium]|jgi:hypothetical protein
MNRTNKIGLLNFHYSTHNYGAVLQAAALKHFFDKNGYEAEQINFIPKKQFFSLYRLRYEIGTLKNNLLTKDKNQDLSKIKNNYVFEEFRQKWINTSSNKPINTHKQLVKIKDEYSAIVVGSDQVWRPSMTQDYGLEYFLSFAGNKTKRISYAASFGVDYWKSGLIPFMKSRAKSELKKFTAISVRENSGVDICRDHFDVKAEHVLDPTLLIGREFFDTIIDSHPKKHSVASICYYKIDMPQSFVDALNFFAEDVGSSTTNIYYSDDNGFLPVHEWLSLIRDSKVIITDSFHCVCFSILFNRPFIYIPNEGRGMTRIQSILSELGLEELICKDITKINAYFPLSKDINYISVNEKLSNLREKSEKFITASLTL